MTLALIETATVDALELREAQTTALATIERATQEAREMVGRMEPQPVGADEDEDDLLAVLQSVDDAAYDATQAGWRLTDCIHDLGTTEKDLRRLADMVADVARGIATMDELIDLAAVVA